jgi:hypothetical protein
MNDDGSITFDWDPNDPMWSWMNNLTDDDIKSILNEELKNRSD